MFVTLELLFPPSKLQSLTYRAHEELEYTIIRINERLEEMFDFKKHREFSELCGTVVTHGLEEIKPLFDFFTENFTLAPHMIGYFSCLMLALKHLRDIHNWASYTMRIKIRHNASPVFPTFKLIRNTLNMQWNG